MAAILTVFLLGVKPVNESCSNIIDLLIERRRDQGMTQKDLAKATNLPQSVIARLEGKKNVPQPDALRKVANALGYEVAFTPITE